MEVVSANVVVEAVESSPEVDVGRFCSLSSAFAPAIEEISGPKVSFCLAGTGAEAFDVCWGSSLSSAFAVCPAGKTEADESDDC